ncbi:RNA polymerase sigma factor [Longimonas halophila]|nr:hypothetical protein [Longimonas halophila]
MADSDSPSLLQHLNAVYTLACTLVGPEQAQALTQQVFQHAAAVPPRERPENRTLWMLECTLRAYSKHKPAHADTPDLRTAAAQTLVRDTLPAAWAACSPRDRTLLTAHLYLDLSAATLASLVDLSAEDIETAVQTARATLRATLRDMLVGPQRMLVDTAFPDSRLDDSIRDYLESDHGAAPRSLRAAVTRTIQAERTPSSQTREQRSSRRRSQWLKTGGVMAGLLALFVVAWGLHTLWVGSDTAPSSTSTSLVAFSARHADMAQPLLDPATPDSAQSAWQQTQGTSLIVPAVAQAELRRLDVLALDENRPVPVLRYEIVDAETPLYVLAYSYAQLDALAPRVTLSRALRQTLEAEDTFVEQSVDGRAVLLWRVRSRIYVAVFPADARNVRPQRITPAP